MKKNLSILIILLLSFIPLTRGRAYGSATAQSYLLTNSGNPWSTMALAALKANNIPDAHLKNITGTSAIDYAAPILALAALNKNPRTFGSNDYVAALKNYQASNQIGDPTLLNDDIFGILALIAAGEPVNDPIISNAKGFILIQNTSYGPYLSQINSDAASGLTGWLYLINNSPPSIGAAAYQLVSGDSVVWYYGTSSQTPANDAVDLTVNLTSGQVGGVVTTTPSTTVTFIVAPSNLDFGNLAAGASASQTFTVTNGGNSFLYLEGIVSGDQVFVQNLKIANTPWPNFQTTLPADSNQSFSLSLSVPSSYMGSGQKTGKLTFWAAAQ